MNPIPLYFAAGVCFVASTACAHFTYFDVRGEFPRGWFYARLFLGLCVLLLIATCFMATP